MTAVRVRDLVQVQPIRTVIHLGDARDDRRRDEVARCFVATPEVGAVLRVVFSRMAGKKGEGGFVQGPYGSGKSHLLAYLAMVAGEDEPREQIRSDPVLGPLLAEVPPGSWLVACVPLIDYPAQRSLESLVLESIDQALTERGLPPLPPPTGSRRSMVDSLARALSGAGLVGLLLLVDELSEFLRAKPDAPAFTEDIRFLQFLGERAADIPAIVIAGLQEGIEETGPIAPEAFNKIKDRYASRFHLTAAHVGELVRQRILTQQPGARAQIDELHRRVRSCLPHFSVDAESFYRLYPVHPATLAFLEQLKPLFSQHRGVVDFLTTRLSGSVERGVPALLDAPFDTLLTVDLIYDHFRERIRERIESAPLVDEVMGWWQENLTAIFSDDQERLLALRTLKVLALASLFPYERPVSIRELAEILQVTITDLEPSLNDHAVADLLRQMASKGAYLFDRPSPDGDPLATSYSIGRGADAALIVRAKVRELAAGLTGRTEEILRAVTSTVDTLHLPLAKIERDGRVRRTVPWQSTVREGFVGPGDPWALSADERDRIARDVATTETDFLVFVMPPTLAPSCGIECPEGPEGPHGRQLPPELAALPIAVWIPKPLGGAAGEDELAFLIQARARQLLARKLEKDELPRAKEISRALQPALEDDRRRLTELATRAYFDGSIVGPKGPLEGLLSGGLHAFDQLLERAVSDLLGQRYPRHFVVAPTGALLGRTRLTELMESFLRPGGIVPPQSPPAGIRALLDGYLKAMGLVGRSQNSWHLKIDTNRSEGARTLLELVGPTPVGVEEIYWRLRKGPLGLTRPCFEVILACLLFSGELVPMAQGRRVPLSRLNAENFDRVSQIGREPPLRREILDDLQGLPLLSPKLRAHGSGPTFVRKLWEEIVALKSRSVLGLGALAARFQKARQERLLAHLPLDAAASTLDRLLGVLTAVKIGDTPREGLTAFHRALEEQGLLEQTKKIGPLVRFLEEESDSYLSMASYVEQEDLVVPKTPQYGSLVMRLDALHSKLSSPEVCLEKERLSAFATEFADFREEYQNAYLADHEARLSLAALAPYRRIGESGSYRFATALSRTSLVTEPPVLLRLKEALDAVSRRSCSRLTPFVLKGRPSCSCGHRLGQELRAPAPTTLQFWLQDALKEILAELSSPERRAEIEAARGQAEEWGKTREASILAELAELTVTGPDLPEKLARLASEPLAEILGRVTHLKRPPERDLGSLTGRLSGKSLSRRQVHAIVDEWLGREIAEEGVVRISRGEGSTLSRRDQAFRGDAPALPEGDQPGREDGPAPSVGGGASHGVGPKLSSEEESLPGDGPASPAGGHGLRGDDPGRAAEEDVFRQGGPACPPEALLALWARSHGLPFESVCRLAGLPDPGEQDRTALAEVGRSWLARGRSPGVDAVLARWSRDGVEGRLLQLVLRNADPKKIVSALAAEPIFPDLARQLSTLALKALATCQDELLRWAGAAGVSLSWTDQTVLPTVRPFRELIHGAIDLGIAVDRLDSRRGRRPTTAHGLNERFHLVEPMAGLISQVETAAEELDLTAEARATGVVDRGVAFLADEARAFEADYLAQWPTVFGDATGPLWPHRVVPRVLARLVRELSPPSTSLIVVDAMRWDFYRMVENGYLQTPRSSLRLLETRDVWALAPTITTVNLRALVTGEPPDLGEAPGMLWEEPGAVEESVGPLPPPDGVTLSRVTVLDEQVHTSRLPLVSLFHSVANALEARISPLVDAAPAGALLVFAADHGFCEDRAYRPHGPLKRFRHGGLDPFEVIVPLAVFQKI